MKKIIMTLMSLVMGFVPIPNSRPPLPVEPIIVIEQPVEIPQVIEVVPEPIIEIEPYVEPYVAPLQPTGTCADWMNAAGIVDQASAYTLIMRESGCNPNAVNPSSGSCGLGQQLPCGKWAHQWNEPVGALIDMEDYVFDRYGSWQAALQHSYSKNWY